jgi:Helix-turn-helix domain
MEKLSTGQLTVANVSSQKNASFLAKSAERSRQRERILVALRAKNRTNYDLRKDPVGSFQAPTRIFELRALGYDIKTHRVTVVDEDGFTHPRVALYELVSEPAVPVDVEVTQCSS